MERYRQEFYDTMYAQPRDVQVSGILGAFYLLLRRFEDHQEDVVYQLLPTGDRFLDIGCGYGFLVLRATAKFEDVYGIDIAPRRIGWAQAKAEQEHPDSSRIHFFVANADGQLPFNDSVFDTVACVAVFEHLFDPHFVMAEFRRVLRHGGALIMEVPNVAWLPRRLTVLIGKLPTTSEQRGWDGGHLHYFTMSTLCALLKENGFRIVAKTGSGVFARWRNWWPSLLTGDLIVKGIKC